MNFFQATIFGFTAWRVCSAAALLVLYVVLRIHWARAEAKRQEAAKPDNAQNKSRAETNASKKRQWKTKPPVDLTDTQRIDHLHRHLSMQAGEQADLKDLTFGQLPKLRIAFAGVENSSGQDYARIKVELGGASAECGQSVQQLGENDFLVPRGKQDDHRCTIHYTCGKSEAVSFLKVNVSKFDAVKQSASIEVFHVRGRRAA